MSQEKVNAITMQVSAAVAQYRFVKMATAAKIIQAAAVGDDSIGVSLEGRSAGDITAGNDRIAVACVDGCKTWITVGATAIDVSAGVVALCSDATGRAVPVSAATDRVLGYALQSSATANSLIEMLLVKGASHRDA